LSLKQQDFGLGGGDRIDALEWQKMAFAKADADTQALSGDKPGGASVFALEAQRALDRFISSAQQQSAQHGGFQVFCALKEPSTASPRVGMFIHPASVLTCTTAYIGEDVILDLWATEDCYVYVVEQDSSGHIEPLLPSKIHPRAHNFLRANVHRQLPDKSPAVGDDIDITFCEPPGLERVVVVATRTPWEEYAAFAAIAEPRARTVALTRGVHVRRMSVIPDGSGSAGGAALAARAPPVMAVAEIQFTLLRR
jgi:hypothetical protein